jgi:2-polyprenyl-6-methoxyphenol hydroxylase-like FAD-dependent oxidoreductase
VIGRAVVIGGSIAGLATGIGLARRGWTVTIVERDPTSPVDDGDGAFTAWHRPGVPQWQQGHSFAARARNLLVEHIPEVLDRLTDDGIETLNLFRFMAPPEQWCDEDEAFGMLFTRRPGFELALRRTGEAEPGMDLLSPASAAGLIHDSSAYGVPRVCGVRLTSGDCLPADLVIDCSGRRTPVPAWLRDDLGIAVPEESQACDLVYYSRYLRLLPSSGLSMIGILGVGGELDGIGFAGFTGDHDTIGLVFTALPDDTEARLLRHTWAWDALAAAVPAMAPWVAPENSAPLHDPSLMANFSNVRRHLVVGGRPLASGLLLVGDALSTTNPQYGWGASMALTGAFAAVAAATEATPDDAVLAYEQAVGDEVDAVYQESAAADRWRTYRWRHQEIPAWDHDAMERQSLIAEGLMPGARHDPILGRAMLRRINLLDAPDATLDDAMVRASAERSRSIIAAKPPRRLGPSRRERSLILAGANPLSDAERSSVIDFK